MRIEQIQLGLRYCMDLGDLRPLVDSISEVGLLHPVVVTPEGRLIAGQRRLDACSLLRRTAEKLYSELPQTRKAFSPPGRKACKACKAFSPLTYRLYSP